ncbi:hypothetical protein JG688_00012396 [Phytophthora aleatoria]|uniref:Uncharacterized protein n=1 Tax=Phytophthora aleatoria TaxID=2496075 RepID=A0A8J5M4N0_9STRA|nr:hypothetical protein JG688_00012396 [Phytophthora aleatoria]
MAMFNKVDEMDVKAAAMIKGETPEEAEKIYHQLLDQILPLLQGMERKGITPESLKVDSTFLKLTKNEREPLQQFYKTY